MLNLIKYEKSKMNKIRFIMNYYIVLPFLALAILGGVASAVFMSIDEMKYLPVIITYFIMVGVAIIGLLSAMSIVRKQEIILEISKKDFSIDSIEDIDKYEFISNEEFNVILSRYGIRIVESFLCLNREPTVLIFPKKLRLADRISRILLEFILDKRPKIAC